MCLYYELPYATTLASYFVIRSMFINVHYMEIFVNKLDCWNKDVFIQYKIAFVNNDMYNAEDAIR